MRKMVEANFPQWQEVGADHSWCFFPSVHLTVPCPRHILGLPHILPQSLIPFTYLLISIIYDLLSKQRSWCVQVRGVLGSLAVPLLLLPSISDVVQADSQNLRVKWGRALTVPPSSTEGWWQKPPMPEWRSCWWSCFPRGTGVLVLSQTTAFCGDPLQQETNKVYELAHACAATCEWWGLFTELQDLCHTGFELLQSTLEWNH